MGAAGRGLRGRPESLHYPYSVSFRNGRAATIENFYDLATFWQIFFGEVYGVRNTDRRIIDAGANCGYFTLYSAMKAPEARMVSIEPFPATFERLRKTVSDNGLEQKVILIRAALEGRDGTTHMDSRDEVASQFRRLRPSGGIAVDSISLASVLARADWTEVDLLKLDIEGSEFEVLLNTPEEALRRIERIAMEFHPRYDHPGYSPEILLDRLQGCGFRLQMRRDDGEGYGIAFLSQE
jgi:FkbM family methyltransferase